MRSWMRSGCAIFALSIVVFPVRATDYQVEYDKRIKASQHVGVLGKDVAGDRINFYTGSTSFYVEDLGVPGNSALRFGVGRSYTVEYDHMVADSAGTSSNPVVTTTRQYAFGDWDLDVPYLTGRFHQNVGWQVDSTTPSNRCSVVGQVKADGQPADGLPKTPTSNPPTGLHGGSPFNGYTLHVNGEDQSLLVATLPNSARPATGGPYHWLTERHWWFSCLPATAQSGNGEAFLAIAPDGTKYWFDKISRRNVAHLEQDVETGDNKVKRGYTFAADFYLLATRVEDRFGNWVTYQYSNDSYARLQSITGYDGRQISVTYGAAGYVESVTDGTRTVHYEYSGSSLSQVVLPDGSAWTYALSGLSTNMVAHTFYPATSTGYVLTPSGARVDYEVGYHFQASPEPCITTQSNSEAACSTTLGLQRKTITGPGLASQTWQYAYGMPYNAFIAACGPTLQTCPTRIWTDEISPDYAISRRMYGNVRNVDETLLVQELQGVVPTSSNQSAIPPNSRINASLRAGEPDLTDDALAPTVATTTVTGAPMFFREVDYLYQPIGDAVRLGVNPLGSYGGSDSLAQVLTSERHLSPVKRETVQDGRRFTWMVATCLDGHLCIDPFGRVTKQVRSSGPSL